jgi:hypothetical protein
VPVGERVASDQEEVLHGLGYAGRKLDAEEEPGPVVAGHLAHPKLARHGEDLIDRIALSPVVWRDLPEHAADNAYAPRRYV